VTADDSDGQLAAWYGEFAAEQPDLIRELGDESEALMREVLAVEDAGEQAAYQRYQRQLATGR
jgi:demethoxyubiquinone hydroxylase (CLK1/Coq7/Cat5 family)